jgi:acyl carrier protein
VRPRDEIIASLRQWLLAHHTGLDGATLEETTDIIDTRTLDSLDLVEFILFLEQESGRPILVEGLEPAQLRTLSGIYESFFKEHA